MELIEILQYDYAIRAFIASSLVGVMCGILGCFIVLRNMALIGDALSHAILPGVVVGFIIAGHSVLAFFTGAVTAGLITAIMITWLQRNVKTKDDAAIGIVFTAMFALGVMGISYVSRQEGVHLDMKDFLFGNVLGIADQDLWLTGLITLYVIASVSLLFRYFFITTFQPTVARTMGISTSVIHYFLMLLLSFAVVASLQSVGVILVVAMLIIPASTAYLLTDKLKTMLIISALVGLFATTSGLLIAILLQTTPGPAMTVNAALIYLITVFVAPKRGLIINYFRKRNKRRKILFEDILKQMVRLYEKEQLSLPDLQAKMGLGKKQLTANLRQLENKGFVKLNKNELDMTRKGTQAAYSLIRAHRLWETYLVERMGLSPEQIHEEAEKFEHILTPELMDKMEDKLGYPKKDPHGSPIPQRTRDVLTMAGLKPGQNAIVTTEQINEQVALHLWKTGITPNTPFAVISLTEEGVKVSANGREITISPELARSVKVSVIE